MATIRDIARMSGYSIGTVSRVINHRADVSEETRSKVEEIIREQNYQPNTSARTLRRSASSEISILVRGNDNTCLHSLLEKVQICIREHGENANVQFIGETDDEVAVAAELVQSLRPKGLIFLGGNIPSFRKEFSKIDVLGENASPLFRWLSENTTFQGFKGPMGVVMNGVAKKMDKDFKNNGNVKWNFTKFLISRDGEILARFEPTEKMETVKEQVAAAL